MRTWDIFVDESGDHSLLKIDTNFPVFVLAAVLIKRDAYIGKVIPELARLKAEHWGHEGIVLHSSEIRRCEGPFVCLQVPSIRTRFLGQLEVLMRELPYTLYVSVLDKRGLGSAPLPLPGNLYSIALTSCIRRILASGLVLQGDWVQVVAESRGAHEDAELREALMVLPADATATLVHSGGGLRFTPKRLNVAGLQLADLCARPYGRWVIDPIKSNRSVDLLNEKMQREGGSFELLG